MHLLSNNNIFFVVFAVSERLCVVWCLCHPFVLFGICDFRKYNKFRGGFFHNAELRTQAAARSIAHCVCRLLAIFKSAIYFSACLMNGTLNARWAISTSTFFLWTSCNHAFIHRALSMTVERLSNAILFFCRVMRMDSRSIVRCYIS